MPPFLAEVVQLANEKIISKKILLFQPDRTNCISYWLDNVIEMVNNRTCAKNITEKILENISKEDLALPSGTVIKLIKNVFPNLTSMWGMAPLSESDKDMEENVNLSSSIVQDFIDISSDLYYQQYAWDEMNFEKKEIYSPELIQLNEIIAYRYA